jgi:4-amino-4-deoxy-L-arabinose transferase-like glycosyltransferase
MNILMFLVSFVLLVASLFGMGLAFNTPGYEAIIFMASLLVMTASFALPGRWLRNL